MNDQTNNLKLKIESIDPLGRSYYDGKLSVEDTEFLQTQCEGINYEIKKDAKLIVQFRQSYRSIELLTKMLAKYDIELHYSNHSMKFKRCSFDSIKSVADNNNNLLVEVNFICEAKPGLPVEFEHIKTID